MGKNDSRGIGLIAAYIIASPVLMLVLGFVGLFAFGSFLLALFDPWLIAISLIGTAAIAAASRKALTKAIPGFSIIAGFLYWAFHINGILSLIWSLLTFWTVFADIMVVLFWSSILGVIAKKV